MLSFAYQFATAPPPGFESWPSRTTHATLQVFADFVRSRNLMASFRLKRDVVSELFFNLDPFFSADKIAFRLLKR